MNWKRTATVLGKSGMLLLCILAGAPMDVRAQNSDPSALPDRTEIRGCAPVQVLVGPEQAKPGQWRYRRTSDISGQGVVVEFSIKPNLAKASSRGAPPLPPLSELIADPQRQVALNEAAKPGEWVTPPAVIR